MGWVVRYSPVAMAREKGSGEVLGSPVGQAEHCVNFVVKMQ